MWDSVLDEEFLAGVFARHRTASSEKVIRFPLFVELIGDALLEHHGSGHQSFTRAREEGALAASLQAMYGKLARVPLALSQGLLVEATDQLRAVCPPLRATPLPDCVAHLTVLALDGKKLKHPAHRLKILRPVRGHVLAAKVAVAVDLATGLATAFSANVDGEARDAPRVPDLRAQVRARYRGELLYVADRQFCDLVQPRRVRQTGDHYLIRYNAKVGFHADASRPVRHGTDAAGRAYHEEWGWLGSPSNPRRPYVRRITLDRPGEEAVILVTDLLDADAYPAADLLTVYRQRWTIERVFQRITEVFPLRRWIGSRPQAGVFQAGFCLLLYNVLAVLRGYVAEAQQRAPEALSLENLFTDVHRQLVAVHEVLSTEEVLKCLDRRLVGAELRPHLRGLLATEWSARWLKAPAKKKPAQPCPKRYVKGGHTSVYRLLQEARRSRRKGELAGRK